jgi:excisionase family DNA binding protein
VPRLLLTVEEATRCLCIGRANMFELVLSGAVPSVRIGKLRRVRLADLEKYVASLDG